MARITVEDCVDKFPSRFELVLIASHRAKKLHSGELPTVEKENDKNTVIALREIAETTIPINEMKENLISQYQTYTILDEEEDVSVEVSDQYYPSNTKNSNLESTNENIHKQVENEIKVLSSTEDKDLGDHYEISEDAQSEEEHITEDNAKENKIY